MTDTIESKDDSCTVTLFLLISLISFGSDGWVQWLARTCHPSDKNLGGFMFDFFFPTHPFGGQTLRLVAQAQEGGGDVFDIARTCNRIQPGDKDSWEREWLHLAQTIETNGKEALAAGHTRTAAQFFFHANQYYRMADVFL